MGRKGVGAARKQWGKLFLRRRRKEVAARPEQPKIKRIYGTISGLMSGAGANAKPNVVFLLHVT